MMAMTVLPNFTILADVKNPNYLEDIIGKLRLFCVQETNVETVDSFKLSSNSFWRGLNRTLGEGCIGLVNMFKKYDVEIPANVMCEIEKWESKFGAVTLVGDDCLRVTKADILAEVKNNSKLKEVVYEIDGDLVYFSKVNISDLKNIFENEIGYPIKIHRPKLLAYIIKVSDSRTYAVKAKDAMGALTSLYNVYQQFNEMDLRNKFGLKKKEITEEDIQNYFKLLIETQQVQIKGITHHAISEPVVINSMSRSVI